MFLDTKHLRSLLAISETGSMVRAAESLHLTQSALSHQIKGIERHYDVPLFLRSTKPLTLTPAGQKVVELARQVLPCIAATEEQLKRFSEGEAGRLHIAIECHACFEWLRPVLVDYRKQWPDVEVDIRMDVSFDPLPSLQRGDVDLVVTSDPSNSANIVCETLCDYRALLIMAPEHPLASKAFIEPQDLADQTLITYPVERQRLDIFRHFLQPAQVEPANVRQSDLTAIILLLVASGKGVTALPDWVLDDAHHSAKLTAKPLGSKGMSGTLFAAVRATDSTARFITDFIKIARNYHSRRHP